MLSWQVKLKLSKKKTELSQKCVKEKRKEKTRKVARVSRQLSIRIQKKEERERESVQHFLSSSSLSLSLSLSLSSKVWKKLYSKAWKKKKIGKKKEKLRSSTEGSPWLSGCGRRFGREEPLQLLVFLSIWNVITSMLWGDTLESEAERSSEFRKLVGDIVELLGKPNVSDFIPATQRFDLQGLEKKMMVFRKRFDRIFTSIIDQKKKKKTCSTPDGNGVGKDFLDFMLRLEEEEAAAAAHDSSTTPFTITHVKAILMDMVVGGTDTTSNTIEVAMAEMMNNPDTLKRVQEELDQVVGKDNIVEESHIPKLHYLSLVIKEVLCLHPALPLLVPHCPSSTSAIGGYTIPQGSRVFVNVWAIHRDPLVWENPLEFKPERFSSTESKWDYNGGDFTYFPFGSGRRICAGISMAERMTAYSLASLLHSFDWKLPEGTVLDLEEKFGIVLMKAKPLVAIPTPRLANLHLYTLVVKCNQVKDRSHVM